jgi:hypothetical protein
MYYRNAQAAIVVYDVTKATSLEKAKTWVKELQRQANPNIIIALAGNKIDLVQGPSADTSLASDSEDEGEPDDATATPGEAGGSPALDSDNVRQVSRDEADAYAKEAGLLFFEISAKTGEGVVEIFTEIGMSAFHFPRNLLSHSPPPHSQEDSDRTHFGLHPWCRGTRWQWRTTGRITARGREPRGEREQGPRRLQLLIAFPHSYFTFPRILLSQSLECALTRGDVCLIIPFIMLYARYTPS